jgi:hypothetical protein
MWDNRLAPERPTFPSRVGNGSTLNERTEEKGSCGEGQRFETKKNPGKEECNCSHSHE